MIHTALQIRGEIKQVAVCTGGGLATQGFENKFQNKKLAARLYPSTQKGDVVKMEDPGIQKQKHREH